MKYCTECGNSNQDNHAFCMKCGAELDKLEKIGLPAYETQPISNQPIAPILLRRSFVNWWLVSILFSPLAFFYLYLNFEDMNKLEQARPAKEGPSMYMDNNQILMYIVLSALIPFFIIIVRYWKYDKFHKYLEYQSNSQSTIPISGKKCVGLFVTLFLLLIAGNVLLSLIGLPIILGELWLTGLFIGLGSLFLIASIVISIYFIYSDYIWQKAMNEQILMIDPYAEEKALF